MLKLIEMFCAKLLSPSVRRAWIEMACALAMLDASGSPSVRRAWIEMSLRYRMYFWIVVALREEGVD